MSKKIIAGNWKQNGTLKSSIALTKNIISALSTSNCKHEIIIFPPSVYFMPIKELISKTKIKIGSQNVSAYENGAFTGEISASMLKDLKINYLTIHISSGLEALKATKKVSGKIKLIGVTILTSLDNKALKDIGFNKDVKKLVLHQARMANKAKLDAIVCSAHEVKLVKKVFKKEIITPGIRFNSKSNDQKRVLTPKQAYKNGSDWLVMGRPITKGNIKKNIQNLIDHLSQ